MRDRGRVGNSFPPAGRCPPRGPAAWLRSSFALAGAAVAVVFAGAGVALAQQPPAAADEVAAAPRKKRQPPPAVIPVEETKAAGDALRAGRYEAAVTAAKAALNKNERYTPAMLIMAKAYYRLGKYEWTRKLWEMMQANGASESERCDVYQMLAFLEVDQKNTPGAIELFKKAAEVGADNAVVWNNLGAQYLVAKNYRDATPVLEKSTQLQPGFAKAFLNLGSAYRGDKQYEKAEAAYKRALQIFPNYADAVFNLGILYLDADKMPSGDTISKLNTAISYLQKYKQMMGATLPQGDPVDSYVAEGQDKIIKEQKRIERQRKAEERDRQRAAQKGAAGGAAGQKPGGTGAAPAPGAAAPAAPPAPEKAK